MLPLVLPFLILAQTPQDAATVRANVRQQLEAVYKRWGEARVTYDLPTFEATLLPDFYVVLPEGRQTRQQFIDEISKKQEGVVETRFESKILTINKDRGDWVAVITEKLEGDITRNGKTFHAYSFWVTKDGWRKTGDTWKAKYSEAIGNEGWRSKPPIDDWDK